LHSEERLAGPTCNIVGAFVLARILFSSVTGFSFRFGDGSLFAGNFYSKFTVCSILLFDTPLRLGLIGGDDLAWPTCFK
jgi:hypothetical protein